MTGKARFRAGGGTFGARSRLVRFRLLFAVPIFALAACAGTEVSNIGSGSPTPSATPTAVPTPTALIISVLDVGQGASTLIQGPEKSLLVDAGDEAAGSIVLTALANRHLVALDYVVATHPHADHLGGLDEVLHVWPVSGGVFDNGETLSTVAYTNYASAASGAPGGRHTMTIGQVLDLGQGATATCVAVNGTIADGTQFATTDPNDKSVALLVEWGDFRFFVGGDLGGGGPGAADLETPLAPLIGDVDVIQVNHHGSDTSTNSAWLNALVPEVAIISDGDGNTYGHPDPVVLARLTGTDSTVHIPPPDLFLTEKGAAPSGFNGAGDVRIVAYPTTYTIAGKTYDATLR